jgi:hypothetical protein
VIFILREFGANYASELEPWWENPWIKWPAVAVFATLVGAALWWLLFVYMPHF